MIRIIMCCYNNEVGYNNKNFHVINYNYMRCNDNACYDERLSDNIYGIYTVTYAT